ncbi:F-box/kelch-repeat protein SKIP11-like [Rhodamnia argentea]|uniref:F-box/kelch-repeat protein SKIP11-like n=1 Tax=Rhodamnia argentea TaxID=178133 RepID=A0A8B8QFP3_9MYRT|nr:F-box/kelch-repeat protein SKIP11-like [Rhodamnia argentea]XP_030545037.1 F-box/kelch-repeat protein SKIP11-like [Rhodamnia argentea]XP_048134730.1 F-box/kelch-repeat protein SKIP11-like [Rhodamnia argentea]XP_048134731.1 F-box/kelch-repeat protein SKIP11-like [Rhodamnia argentea]
MLEGRSCLVSRMFSSSCQPETNWSAKTCRLEIEIRSSKRLPDADMEDYQRTKSFKRFDLQDKTSWDWHGKSNDGSVFDLGNVEEGLLYDDTKEDRKQEEGSVCRAFLCEESDNQRHAGDSSHSNSLINSIGRDMSINCLVRCTRSDYGSIASLNRSFRSLINTGELYKMRRQNGIVEHWIYFSCNLLEWEAFDPILGRWMRLPRMISNELFIFSDKESLAVGTELLVFTTYMIYRYSILTNSWSSEGGMNAPRCLFGSASLGEIAIVAGGQDPHNNILSSAEMYNSETHEWHPLPSMHKRRKMCSGVFMDGKFYVIGGIGGSEGRVLTCGEEYDLKTGRWTEIPDMSPGRETDIPASAEAPPLVAVVNNELYSADYANMEVRKYDKVQRIWFPVGRLPESAASTYGWGLAFRACGDSLIVIGGPQNFIELNSWVPSEGPPRWNLLARKRSSNFVYNCAVMGC